MVSDNVTNPSLSTVITDATCGLSNGNINLSVIPSGIYMPFLGRMVQHPKTSAIYLLELISSQ
ncbi:MAG: hypothetical protein IPO26_20145 [Saprospiraceae bacterium]|nr:hypothetical protein [Saprospiraceae bacterium]